MEGGEVERERSGKGDTYRCAVLLSIYPKLTFLMLL